MPNSVVTLKPRTDAPIRAGHPWVFSNALADEPSGLEPGQLVEVRASNGEPLGLGTWNGHTSIRVRMMTRDVDETIDADFFAKRFRALDAWKRSRLPKETTGYRLVHAEADALPGLVIDRFDDVFVYQLHTAGADRLRQDIVDALTAVFSPRAIVERSDLDVRKLEGLKDLPTGVVTGKLEGTCEFKETGLTFLADPLNGQKTGFFLDQRPSRVAVGTLSKHKRVANLFGYTGAFSVHAAAGGASFVSTIDVSHRALETAEHNIKLNGFDPEDEKKFSFIEADVFDLVRERAWPDGPYDLIICDPPALAKSEKQVEKALRAYTELNTACFAHLEPGGILVTSSCSGRVDPEAFRSMLRIAAGRAGRDVRVLEWVTQPVDHAERLAFPEGRYLKTAVLEVV